jgi:hypothetical protein
MRGIAWRLYLGTGALATGAYHLPPEAGGAVLNVVVGASAGVATGIRWHRPARRRQARLGRGRTLSESEGLRQAASTLAGAASVGRGPREVDISHDHPHVRAGSYL